MAKYLFGTFNMFNFGALSIASSFIGVVVERMSVPLIRGPLMDPPFRYGQSLAHLAPICVSENGVQPQNLWQFYREMHDN